MAPRAISSGVCFPSPKTVWNFLDAYLKEHGGEVDYIHGEAVTDELGAKPGNIGGEIAAIPPDSVDGADGIVVRLSRFSRIRVPRRG